jgi:hypothetical protein
MSASAVNQPDNNGCGEYRGSSELVVAVIFKSILRQRSSGVCIICLITYQDAGTNSKH